MAALLVVILTYRCYAVLLCGKAEGLARSRRASTEVNPMESCCRVGGRLGAILHVIGVAAHHACRRDEGEGAAAVGLEAERYHVGAACTVSVRQSVVSSGLEAQDESEIENTTDNVIKIKNMFFFIHKNITSIA